MLSSAWMRYCLILWTLDVHLCSRSPQGERGLKSFKKVIVDEFPSRSPQGERGLKLTDTHGGICGLVSLPARGITPEFLRTFGFRP